MSYLIKPIRILALLGFMCAFALKHTVAQAGMTLYAGPSLVFSPDKIVTAAGEGHFGYVVGAHARLNSDFMYFMLTGEYGTFDLVGNKKWNFIGGDDLSYIKGKIGMGFDLKKWDKIILRSKLQGTLLFVNDYEAGWINSNDRLMDNGYTAINEGLAGVSTCIGLTFGSLDLDLEYDHGLYNLYNTHKSSKIHFLNLTTGLRF